MPLLRSSTTGIASQSSGKARDSRHSSTVPVYRLPVLSRSNLVRPITFLFTLLDLPFHSVTHSIFKRSSVLPPKLLFLRPNAFRYSEPAGTVPASSRHLRTLALLRRRCHLLILRSRGHRSALCSSLLSARSSTSSDTVPLSNQDPYHYKQCALFFRREDAITIVNSASPFHLSPASFF